MYRFFVLQFAMAKAFSAGSTFALTLDEREGGGSFRALSGTESELLSYCLFQRHHFLEYLPNGSGWTSDAPTGSYRTSHKHVGFG